MTPAIGPVFWILTVLAAVAVITYFERLIDLRRAQIDYQDFLKGVVNVLDAGNADEALHYKNLFPEGLTSLDIGQRMLSSELLKDLRLI